MGILNPICLGLGFVFGYDVVCMVDWWFENGYTQPYRFRVRVCV